MAKLPLHPEKRLLCVWWDHQGILYYEILPKNVTVNSQIYQKQLSAVDKKIKENRQYDKVLQHDNARPHVAKKTQEHISTNLKWEVLPHPPYSPDLTFSDFYFFVFLTMK